MEIINVLTSTNSLPDSIDSFIATKEPSDDAARAAESFFLEKARELGLQPHEEKFVLDDGYFTDGNVEVRIIWSNEKKQF